MFIYVKVFKRIKMFLCDLVCRQYMCTRIYAMHLTLHWPLSCTSSLVSIVYVLALITLSLMRCTQAVKLTLCKLAIDLTSRVQ